MQRPVASGAAARAGPAAAPAPKRHNSVDLYAAELAAEPMTACVVGASGFLGSHIVSRLLAGGHTVHGTTRDVGDTKRTAHLRELPGAAERLRLFQADMTKSGALDAAAAGCRALFFAAGPVQMQVSKANAEEALVRPYVVGTETTLAAATTAGVQRVIYTSSVAACTAGNEERGAGHVMTEADWAIKAAPDFLPYNYAKKRAEQRAWELDAAQDGPRRWRLVSLLPALMLGPPVGPTTSQSAAFCADILAGKFARAMPPLGFCVVDVRDVAAAAVLAAVLPKASGRYLLTESSVNVINLIKAVERRPRWAGRKMVGPPAPKWLLRGVCALTTLIDWPRIQAQYGTLLAADCTKARRELGVAFAPAADALDEMLVRMIELGQAKA